MSLWKKSHTELRQGYRQARLNQSQPRMLADFSSESFDDYRDTYRLLQDATDSWVFAHSSRPDDASTWLEHKQHFAQNLVELMMSRWQLRDEFALSLPWQLLGLLPARSTSHPMTALLTRNCPHWFS